MIYKFILRFILISLSFNLITSNTISLSLKYYSNITLNDSLSSVYKLLNNLYLYTNLKIGDPEYNIKTYILMDSPYFSMSSNFEPYYEKDIFYDIYKSNTFQNISFLDKYYIKNIYDIEAKEKFKLNIENNNKEIIIKDLEFILERKGPKDENISLTEIYYLNLGLQIISNNKYKYNFITLLKQRKIIENFNWFIIYDNDINNNNSKNNDDLYNLDEIVNIKSKLLIGSLPHLYNPKKFKENQLISVYSNNFEWLLFFKNIYYFYKNDTNLKKVILYNNRVQIDFNELFIYGPSLYYTYIKRDYFNEYLSKNICRTFTDDKIEGIFCEKSNFSKKNLKNFPTLYFFYNELNYTFEFNYRDLFIEKDNKYIFLIVIEKNVEIDEWYIGFSLLKKYQFVFNQEAKTIGFYNTNITNEDSNKIDAKNTMNYIIYLIIFLSWVVFICIGFFIGKYFYKKYKNKKRANELDDNYEYITEKNIN